MAELSPAASLVVRSPRHRQTLSLLRQNRRPPQRDPHPHPHPRPTTSSMAAAGPKPSEVYGFVGSISTVIATGVCLVWAYTPEPCLHSLGITYYPTKYWALAAPSFVMVAVALSVLVYVGFNFLATPPPTSLTTIFGPCVFITSYQHAFTIFWASLAPVVADEYSRERTATTMSVSSSSSSSATAEAAETPIEPISDISIHHINCLMFAD